MFADFIYEPKPQWWVHPETGVTIFDEDMPWELRPADES